ncbi:NLR family, CARD domain containing 3 [Seminavis robusta]|uniref:NLR family, CARD domain containing 3 n=1 Tax=Seminavis robusta TaxID=568900 RepID=A0A9N8E5G5_9STRA|nr:NLR family, CARD domain containing 3 [Seminavis robusta]|eukprot:Sro537_g162330.1 NLR family, CARD domain containing 3 (424) ;mRNA; f:23664-24935
MSRWEASIVEHLELNRKTYFILKLEWEVEDAYRLAEAISRNQTVRYVFLYDNFLASCSLNGRREVLKALACLTRLESLVYISNGTRVKIPLDALTAIFKAAKKLSTFELHGPNLVGTSSDFAEFSHTITKLPLLKSFKLLPAYFERGRIDLGVLIDALAKVDTLEELRMCLYCDKGSHLSSHALQSLCRSKVLRILDLRWPHLCDEHLTTMSKELRYNAVLRELRVAGNNLAYSCFSVAEMIEVNEGIEHLTLACRGLGNSECCKALWKAIDANSFLKEITFENTDETCNRGQDFSELMGTVLEENNTLVTLRLYNMGLDDETCEALGRALQVNVTLKALDVRKGNRSISDEGFEALASMLQRNYTLTSLHTNATGAIKKQMDMCLKLNQSAKKLQDGLDDDVDRDGGRPRSPGSYFTFCACR